MTIIDAVFGIALVFALITLAGVHTQNRRLRKALSEKHPEVVAEIARESRPRCALANDKGVYECYGAYADPRCQGGNCTKHCQAYGGCQGRCLDVWKAYRMGMLHPPEPKR